MRKWCGRFHLWVYFATVWWGANLTRSRWLMKCHSQLCGTGDPREDTLTGNSSCVPFSHVLHAICCMGWWHCERWAAHHSLGLSLTLPIRYLMYSVYSWLLQGQEISCHRILIEFGFLHVLLKMQFTRKAAWLHIFCYLWEHGKKLEHLQKNLKILTEENWHIYL